MLSTCKTSPTKAEVALNIIEENFMKTLFSFNYTITTFENLIKALSCLESTKIYLYFCTQERMRLNTKKVTVDSLIFISNVSKYL